MTIAKTVLEFLQQHNVRYAVVAHPHSETSKSTAERAHVPLSRMAKAVVLADRDGYLMVVLPGDRHVDVAALSHKLRRNLRLAQEERVAPVFKDCAVGAIPPLGPVYGMETILDDSLVGLPEVYFEAGDHEELIRVAGEDFVRMLAEARHAQFSH
jgi:Ala-tRNA(Pro) deacylase